MGVILGELKLQPADRERHDTPCRMGNGTCSVQWWLSEHGEVIVEQVRVGGVTLDWAWLSQWAVCQLAHDIKTQLRASEVPA